ncbi:hypothetical protein [Novosphingobium kaempferiae]|uniref:hypothetical protein n=1 Tax=Novosphingobium kaempferiae TaxID=2896849 RepID=UPI001E4FED96|nr:hypothetical protein [Novosphingobium kaempferiae]
MSDDRRPAKVRVVSAGAPIPAEAVPARRRGDRAEELEAPAVAIAAKKQDASLLWVVGAVGLFLVGCVVGGALFVLSGLASATPL